MRYTARMLVRLNGETASSWRGGQGAERVSRAEVIRMALRRYLRPGPRTRETRGIVRSKLSLDRLEEAYWLRG